ncbi:MAG TPA: 2-oxoglutarate dehydrogenase E1 component [Polyangiaceae bacterium]|nr:MAG: 2-oxoglutarate dehydrogenase E1 component [Deltaproteobacteria bacterium ADurb.Bin207]HNS97497.1 2-oxoglutarate dehydrogenase E1 component [Polyangiaceae bacterium]HNZ22997.1 2-oxoglutarate dehydrogenase E1 component [Polyangiaceae bacterium]HOD24371.1 2-oxoglutarate dehydrogenase E1 component [Polyangiaceae bacterium]HOE49010.1 2-oxoglutarate dehydrogenase E1 component [Polyangiaceae bacterium]
MAERKSLTGVALGALSNASYADELYEQYRRDPSSVGPEWQTFFQGFDLASCPRTCVAATQARGQSKVASLIYAYRNQGHLIAKLDPLGNNPTSHPALALETYGLSEEDLPKVFDTGHLGGPQRATLLDILAILKETYCESIGVEYLHIQDVKVRRWLQAQMEPRRNQPQLSNTAKRQILQNLVDAELFETFIQSRYPGQKRFSLEGAESLIPAVHAIVELAPDLGVEDFVMGMAHRGRLNVLANILDKSYAQIFSEFEDNFLPESVAGDGDVKYHRGFSSVHVNHAGKPLNISLTSNPSHLEAVNPVVLGRARAKQRRLGDTVIRSRVLPLLIHGDAAFAGQGLVAETLNLSGLPGYTTGGTIHLVVNNQIGFTTGPAEARSTMYSTDVAKMIEVPIFHVNGDDPDAVVYVAELALRFRQEFHRDVVIDMVCYRRHGHNEGDEPAFTQPVLYRKIKDRPSIRRLYQRRLIDDGVLEAVEGEQIADKLKAQLQTAFEEVKRTGGVPEQLAFQDAWEGLDNPYSHTPVETGAAHTVLVDVARALSAIPDGFSLNPKVAKKLPETRKAVEEHGLVDWAGAELLAFGSLLHEGVPVRLSGQDSARGTFSHRHSVWQDMDSQESYIPLRHIHETQARFCVYNSMLSEAAVLGFDYGYSLDEPHMLVLWEAQFGDFANGAQVIIDQFIVSSLSKWKRASGLVMLLPHGYEGQGPEHSNAYLERYLAACAEDNIQVCNFTTPAQYFHALRRQVRRNFRRPLIVMSPKSLLRNPQAVSPVDDLVTGRFHELLDDPAPPKAPRRLVLCSGKVFYDLANRRKRDGIDDVAIVRVEQFYPYSDDLWNQIESKYDGVQEVLWVQEEPQNRGGWTFAALHFQRFFPRHSLRYVGREASASPAVGSLRRHQIEQEQLIRDALGLADSHKPVRGA